jgi:hypothetical protein
VWNEVTSGYLVSFHYRAGTAKYSEPQRIRAAVATAESTQLRKQPFG